MTHKEYDNYLLELIKGYEAELEDYNYCIDFKRYKNDSDKSCMIARTQCLENFISTLKELYYKHSEEVL